ncbi:WD40 repeat domain-containing protein [uncultured Nostoc sp.]|uniref:WD40 repeat domain-containing protein n=1 Tax=uncultured Nostoc sp. TaxID=340711 RepID=UPI0035CB1E86
MNKTAQLVDIIEKRQPLAQKIEQVEENKFNGQPFKKKKHQDKVLSVAIIQNGQKIVSSGADGWGNTKKRIEVSVRDERQRQTYFGALNYYTQ